MKIITTRTELVALAKELGVRPDWHEPDEQDVTVRCIGKSFDNAMMDNTGGERGVIVSQHGKAVAFVNLAILFAWATGFQE